MKALRSNPLLHRIFCWLMAIHVINFSIDPPDPFSPKAFTSAGGENLAFNEMESIGEIILEKVLNIPNAIPEQDDPDHPLSIKLIKSIYYWMNPSANTLFQDTPPILMVLTQLKNFRYSFPHSSHAVEIESPPPQLS